MLVFIVGIVISMFILKPILLASWSVNLSLRLESLLFRLAALITSAMALHTYSSIVRSSQQGIISLHPIIGRQFLWASLEETIRKTWIWWVGGGIILLPLLELGEPLAYGLALVLLLGSWVGGIGAGYCINIGSVWVARSPRCHPLLDAVRGQNPREQAAFIYAPGVALILVGLALALASGGLRAVLTGSDILGLFLLLPYLVGGVGFWIALILVEEELLRVGSILVDIDAHWQNVQDEEDPNAVYLDWTAKKNPELLRALRAGWREFRLYPLLSWGVGCAAALMIWTSKLSEGIGIAGLGMVGLGTLSWQLRRSDPPWLDIALGVNPQSVMRSRCQLLLLYGLGICGPVLLSGVWTEGIAFGVQGFSLLFQLLVFSVISVLLSARLSYYLPVAFLLWASLLRFL